MNISAVMSLFLDDDTFREILMKILFELFLLFGLF